MKRLCCLLCVLAVSAAAAGNLRVRVHNFVVNPSTGPVTTITVTNPGDAPFAGTLEARFPAGWKVTPASHALDLPAGAVKQLSFAIEEASDARRTNRYDVAVTVRSNATAVTETQTVVWAGAPYFKPKIDGSAKEWGDAVPIRWTSGGKQTVVSQYWNKKRFCLLVQVEEDRLIGRKGSSAQSGMDAIQFALAPKAAVTGTNKSDRAARSEFLAADSGSMWASDACYLLTKPDTPLGGAGKAEGLDTLRLEDAEVAVKRSGRTTVYELAIPFAHMPALRPTPGREYCFSLLVHDPDGTGIRDLGTIMNLQDSRRNPLAWRSWPNAKWSRQPPFDNKVEFGFCSSVH